MLGPGILPQALGTSDFESAMTGLVLDTVERVYAHEDPGAVTLNPRIASPTCRLAAWHEWC